jgi:cytochrome c oxidase subunit 2
MESFLAQYMPVDASEHGPHLDFLSALVHWLMLILFIGWGAYFIYALFRFRSSRNPRANYHGTTSHFSTYTEAGVAVIEVVLLLGFSIPAWSKWVTPPSSGAHPLEVRVVAEQFAWNIHYPGPDGVFGKSSVDLVSSSNPLGLDPTDPYGKDDVITLNQLHLEVNRPVLVHLSSKDVIHDFSLPVMRVKQDAIPGIDFPIHFTPVKLSPDPKSAARWEIACAQLCGLGHYRMRGQLFVETKEQLNAWMKSMAPQVEAATTAPTAPAAAPATTTAPVTAPPPAVPLSSLPKTGTGGL